MRASICPFLTLSPSSTFSSVISPETSGLIFTSISGYTLPLAVTISVIFLRITFSEETFIPSSLPITPFFFNTTSNITNATRLMMIHSSFLFMCCCLEVIT